MIDRIKMQSPVRPALVPVIWISEVDPAVDSPQADGGHSRRQGKYAPMQQLCDGARRIRTADLLGAIAEVDRLTPSRTRGPLVQVCSESGARPWPVTTDQAVFSRMRRSRERLRWSTYQTSSSIRSSQGMPARPWTWAQPVIPGRTSWRRFWCGV